MHSASTGCPSSSPKCDLESRSHRLSPLVAPEAPMTPDPRRPIDSAPPSQAACAPPEPASVSSSVTQRAGHAPSGGDHGLEASRTPDPVNRWATEHYGFDDEPVEATAAAVPPPPVVRPRGTRRLHRRALAAGVLGVILTGGVGGAAVAADL